MAQSRTALAGGGLVAMDAQAMRAALDEAGRADAVQARLDDTVVQHEAVLQQAADAQAALEDQIAALRSSLAEQDTQLLALARELATVSDRAAHAEMDAQACDATVEDLKTQHAAALAVLAQALAESRRLPANAPPPAPVAPPPVIPEGSAAMAILHEQWASGQYTVSACAWMEHHALDGRCPFDLGQRAYAPRVTVVDGQRATESKDSLETYALGRLQGEADILVARVRKEGV